MLEDAQQLIPIEIALHPRWIVVDAERQIGCVGNFEEEALDIALRRADIRGCCEDRAVRAVIFGKSDGGDRCLGVVAGAAEEDRHGWRLHLRGLNDDFLSFFRREHRGFAGRAHDQHRRRAVRLLEFEQRRKGGKIDRAVFVERRDQRNERARRPLFIHCDLQFNSAHGTL